MKFVEVVLSSAKGVKWLRLSIPSAKHVESSSSSLNEGETQTNVAGNNANNTATNTTLDFKTTEKKTAENTAKKTAKKKRQKTQQKTLQNVLLGVVARVGRGEEEHVLDVFGAQDRIVQAKMHRIGKRRFTVVHGRVPERGERQTHKGRKEATKRLVSQCTKVQEQTLWGEQHYSSSSSSSSNNTTGLQVDIGNA